MAFTRVWDSSCPRVWDKWESDGTTWVIRDLPPEDDDEAIKILLENLCTDETLCFLSNVLEDPVSVQHMVEFGRAGLAQRVSLACYKEKNGNSKLVALNLCSVICEGDKDDDVIEGERWRNVLEASRLAQNKVDALKYLGINKILCGHGLVVAREYRGAKLGSRILEARTALGLHNSIKGTFSQCRN
ncbi:hypothetical protein PYW07_014190 [Mythimna separata]|uniref:Uncharacterized protein n=1 Tax=Mythimna separata TaxID=271217 RepID=A0AAD7Z0J3_MYTSE|nr:hypothetical protein PYW07_014190 [Mythimna separata]